MEEVKGKEVDEWATVPMGVYMHYVCQVKQYIYCFYPTSWLPTGATERRKCGGSGNITTYRGPSATYHCLQNPTIVYGSYIVGT